MSAPFFVCIVFSKCGNKVFTFVKHIMGLLHEPFLHILFLILETLFQPPVSILRCMVASCERMTE